jgi:hypothetical protein
MTRMRSDPEVERWFRQREHPLEDALRRVREIVLGADPRITEAIKWKTPTFAYRENILSFNPSKNLVSLLFHRGAEIPGEHPRLEGEAVSFARCVSPTSPRSSQAERTSKP